MLGSRKSHLDMTQGSASKLLISFAIPLLLGNLFQQFYNMVDVWVVGRYVSNEAFAAVGTVSPAISTLIALFFGFTQGTGIVLSQYFGAKNNDKVHEAVHTSFLISIFLAVLFTVLGIAATPLLLHAMRTPDNVFPEAAAYLRIYFGGITGLMFYNLSAAMLRSVGDSGRPFRYLVTSQIINIILDLVFVIAFHMGVAGVAWATIIAQFVSAVLGVRALLITDAPIRVDLKELKVHAEMAKTIINVSIPAAIQGAIVSISNLFVQSYINSFGGNVMSGYTAFHKIDQIIIMPFTSISTATATFVGQNLGAGQVDRAKKGVRTSIAMSFAITIALGAVAMFFAPSLVAFFNNKPEVIEYGTLFLRWITPFYLCSCVNHIQASAMRGAGDTKTPMYLMISTYVAARQVFMFIMANFICNEPLPVIMGYPFSWALCTVFTIIAYMRLDMSKTRIVKESENRAKAAQAQSAEASEAAAPEKAEEEGR